MVNYCRVYGCSNRSDRENDRSFYRLPEVIAHQGEKTKELSDERRRLWLANLDQDFSGKNLKNIRICSDHFISKKKAELYDRDNPDWIPTVNMTTCTKTLLKSPELVSDRYQRRKERNVKADAARTLLLLQESVEDTCTVLSNSNADLTSNDQWTEKETQTEIDQKLITAMESDIQCLVSENVLLKEKLKSSCSFSLEAFGGNDEKVKYYTGLPCFQILLTLFMYLVAYLPDKQSLGKFEGFAVTLARLRLNLSVNHLAYQLNTSMSTISRTIAACLDVNETFGFMARKIRFKKNHAYAVQDEMCCCDRLF